MNIYIMRIYYIYLFYTRVHTHTHTHTLTKEGFIKKPGDLESLRICWNCLPMDFHELSTYRSWYLGFYYMQLNLSLNTYSNSESLDIPEFPLCFHLSSGSNMELLNYSIKHNYFLWLFKFCILTCFWDSQMIIWKNSSVFKMIRSIYFDR